MSDNEDHAALSARLNYQLTEDQRINLLVAIAAEMVEEVMPPGGHAKIAKAFSVSCEAVHRFEKRLLAGKLASFIVKSKKGQTRMPQVTTSPSSMI